MEKIKLQLPQVTLICVAGNKHGESIASMYKSMAKVDFGAVKLLTNIYLSATGIEVINAGGLDSWAKYNHFVIKELYKYFTTSHCLIVQFDSWILSPECWNYEWLEYDIIGARGLSDGRPNYNGGFSLRSLEFQTHIANDDFIHITAPEDECLTRLYRKYLEDLCGFKYCTDEVADKFAYELHEPLSKTFGFHNFHWKPYRETIMIKRDGALGDVIALEPVLHYFHQQGYQVALDTQPDFLMVYFQHYFPVVPKSHLNPKLPYRLIDCDMAYEINPLRPVLESYYEMAGIKNQPLRNSILNIRSGNNEKIFNKYVVIHIDDTGMPYRNQYGINWKSVVMFLEEKGYLVFQIGRRVEKEITTYFNTMSLEFMMFFVKGADLFIGLDSGCAQVAVGFNVKSVIMFGSVSANLRYYNFEKIRVVQSKCPSEQHINCYHHQTDVVGKDCFFDKELPLCTQYSATQVINAIKELI